VNWSPGGAGTYGGGDPIGLNIGVPRCKIGGVNCSAMEGGFSHLKTNLLELVGGG